MHDSLDHHPFDLESLAEIGAMTDLMIAAADSRVDHLSTATIDSVLHVRAA